MRTAIKALLGLFLILLVSPHAWADDPVLTIYFHGTGFRLDEPFLGFNGAGPLGTSPNLITTLYNEDSSTAIDRYNYNFLTGQWLPKSIEHEDTHYKFNVNGAGTFSTSTFLDVITDFVDDLAGKIDPNWGDRGWAEINEEALAALEKVREKHANDDVKLNLVGFSRGGVSALKLAHSASAFEWVKKINILNYDPVPGGLDPVNSHKDYFKLNGKVNEYVGIYAEDERSWQFEPIIPQASFNTRSLTVRVPGSHETMVGNIQIDGHATTLNNFDNPDLIHVSQVSQVIAERLLTSEEWGEVPLGINTALGSGGVDTQEEFSGLLTEMENYQNLYPSMQWTSFLPFNFLSGVDICFTNRYPYELRAIWIVPFPFPTSRLFFKGTQRGAPGWQWGNCWITPVPFISQERVFKLNEEVPRISSDTWEHLEALREDPPPRLPNIIFFHKPSGLPDLIGQCSVSVTDSPLATGVYYLPPKKETIEGTTEDPLDYPEQGEYEVHWTWDYYFYEEGQFEQIQRVEVEDTIPPQPETIFLPTVTGVGSAEVTTSPTAEDNCTGTVVGTTFDPTAYSTAGTHEIIWRYEDAVGNSNTQIQKVIVYPTNDLEVGRVGNCMRECAQTVNRSAHDKWGNDISADEFTLDCANYCKPKLKEGYCSPGMDGCCNVMYKAADWDCWAMAGEACTETADCATGLGCYMGTCEAPLADLAEGDNCRPGFDLCQADYLCQQLPEGCTDADNPDPNYYCMEPDYDCTELVSGN